MFTKLVSTIARDKEARLFVERVVVPVAVITALDWLESRFTDGRRNPFGQTSGVASGISKLRQLL